MNTDESNGNRPTTKKQNIKRYEPFKSLIKFIFSFNAVFFVSIVYWLIWNNYYNKIIQMPFWRKGNWLMVALYTILLIFFNRTYGGFKISYLKKRNLIWSQILSIIATNLITYIQISLLDKRFHSVCPMLFMSFLEFGVVTIWVILFQWLYQKLFPARRLLLVYGSYPVFHLEEKIHFREDKYILAGAVSIGIGQEQIMREATQYDAVIIGDIPSHERNRLLKKCLDELPQLLNILKGEMSLVGPRPERPELAREIEKEIPEFSYRLKFKAGLTGYAQVYGKYNTTFYDKLKLDLMYIRNHSLFLDLKLLLLTPKILFMKESTEGVRQENPQREEVLWQMEKKERDKEL